LSQGFDEFAVFLLAREGGAGAGGARVSGWVVLFDQDEVEPRNTPTCSSATRLRIDTGDGWRGSWRRMDIGSAERDCVVLDQPQPLGIFQRFRVCHLLRLVFDTAALHF
jgi:hypothetical protein